MPSFRSLKAGLPRVSPDYVKSNMSSCTWNAMPKCAPKSKRCYCDAVSRSRIKPRPRQPKLIIEAVLK